MTDLMPAVAPAEVELPFTLPSPAPDNPEEALSWLGSTVEEVAEGLRARGIKGRKEIPEHCPIATYLQNWWSEAWAAHMFVGVCGGNTGHTTTPRHITHFMEQFDAGAFPDLIDT